MSGWKHNDTFRIRNCPDIEFFIQDEYKLKDKEKWTRVRDVIEEAIDCKSPITWFINYCSAQNWPVQPPRYIAWNVNKALEKYINNDLDRIRERKQEIGDNRNGYCKCLGVVVIDFVKPELAETIYMLNFKN